MTNDVSSLKNAIVEEFTNRELLVPFVDDLEAALEAQNYPEALRLIDELEEFMDLENFNN